MLKSGFNIWFYGMCILMSQMAYAQNGASLTQGAYSNGLGHTGAAIVGINALNNNPAGLATDVDFGVQISSEQRFLLSDINAASLGLVKRFGNLGSFSIHLENYGLDEFRQSKLSLGYARKLSDKVNAGLKFNFWNTQIDGYGNKSNIGMELGIISQISRELRLGFHLKNPISQSITETTDLNTEIKIGLAYQTNGKFVLLADVTKQIDQTEQFHVGILYQVMEQLDFKIGIATSPSIFTFGVGINLSDLIRFDGANRYHQNLGNTPSVSLSYQKK